MRKSKSGSVIKMAISLAVTLALATGCANMSAKQKGMWTGAAAGAAVGGASGPLITHDRDSDDRRDAAIIGVVAGGIIGGVIGMLTAQEAPPPKAQPKPEPRPEPRAESSTTKTTAAQETAKSGQTVKERIVLRGINFDYDKADIKKEFKPILDEAVNILNKRSDVNVTIEGHTCWLGTDKYNQKLSERRANSVFDYMGSSGISKNRLTPVGKGETQPVADNKTEEGRRMNRRVEFKVMQ